MRIVVLGPTGQVGYDVVGELEKRSDFESIALDRTAVDLDDVQGIDRTLSGRDFDVLINCAGYTAVDGAESEPEAAFRRNAYAVERIARACRVRQARLIHLSTDYVFDGESGRPYRPTDRPAPINVYGASKLAGEALARREHGSGTLIVRTSSVFGLAGIEESKGNFVETILRLSRERDRVSVVAEGAMAPTYSQDLARALIQLVESEAPAGVYHVTNRGRTSWHGFAEAIIAKAGRDTPVDPVKAEDYPTPARRPLSSVLDTAGMERWAEPLPAWQDALQRYLAARERTDSDFQEG